METVLPYFLDWANLLLRWTHLIVGIAWIGASFYFVWLDNSIVPPEDEHLKKLGVGGELWAVHGGGFYNPQKYLNAPKVLPPNLHWFYWESYATWLTGFSLFTIAYLFNPSIMLVDKHVMDLTPAMAVIAALAYLGAGWIVYNAICQILGVGEKADKKVAVVVIIYVVIAAWVACHVFSGRAAFLMTGAMLATIMTANVFFWIIPGQRKAIAALRAGQEPDPIIGKRAKQRSFHNTYFTLPVLFAMLSNHYSMVYSGPNNWIVLVGIMVCGVLIRHYFVSRHKHLPSYPSLIGGLAILLAIVIYLAPTIKAPSAGKPTPTFDQVKAIIDTRCVLCHNAQVASKNIHFDSPELIQSQAALIYQQAVVTKAMPLNNATGITDDERESIAAWFKSLK